MSAQDNPFEMLGIAPTLDVGAIRTAYFQALRRHPPERDPVGFRRVRSAYEAISTPAGAARVWFTLPPDSAAALDPFADVVAELARARERVASNKQRTAVIAEFLEAVRRIKLV